MLDKSTGSIQRLALEATPASGCPDSVFGNCQRASLPRVFALHKGMYFPMKHLNALAKGLISKEQKL